MTLKATFTMPDVQAYILQQKQRGEKAALNALNFAALEFVREARLKTAAEGGFNDITGNLRSSIGYLILQDGQQIYQDFQPADIGTDKATGVATGITFAESKAAEFPKGIVLVCVAGMEYAIYVESKGKDVITGSSLNLITRIKSLLAQI